MTFLRGSHALAGIAAAPVVQNLLPVGLTLCAVEVGSDEGDDQLTEQPAQPKSQQSALCCCLRWRLVPCRQSVEPNSSEQDLIPTGISHNLATICPQYSHNTAKVFIALCTTH